MRREALESVGVGKLCEAWHVDLARISMSSRGNVRVLVAVEGLPRYVVLETMSKKAAATALSTYHSRSTSTFGMPLRETSDNGGELSGEFHENMKQAHIDHRTITALNPRANGLAESGVGMFKLALKKMAQGPNARKAWEEFVPFIQLAYNRTLQFSSKVAPTVTMMAQLPTMSGSVMKAP